MIKEKFDENKYIKFVEVKNALDKKYNQTIDWKAFHTLFPNIEKLCVDHCYAYFEYEGNRQEVIDSMVETIYMTRYEKSLNPYERFDFHYNNYDESIKNKFPILFSSFKEFVYWKLNNTNASEKTRKNYSITYINTLKFLVDNCKKDINKMRDKDLECIFKQENIDSIVINTLCLYLKFLAQNHIAYFTTYFQYHKKKKIKNVDDFYSKEQWFSFIIYATNTQNHIVKAMNNVIYARYWCYVMFNLCVVWRRNDILSSPGLTTLVDFDKYDLEWFSNNSLSLEEAQGIIKNAKLLFEQYLTQKTNVKKHFNIADDFKIAFATSLICVERWRRLIGCETLFDKTTFDSSEIQVKLFGEQFKDFSNRKANRTLLTLVDEVASELNITDFTTIATYMRSHKPESFNLSNTTSQYLKSTYVDDELNKLTMHLYDRGMFGWIYDGLLAIANNDIEVTTKEKTNQIMILKNQLSIQDMQQLNTIVESYASKKEKVINELLHMSKEEIHAKLQDLYKGASVSKCDNIYCLQGRNCNYKLRNDCIFCEYSIPTIYLLYSISNELDLLFEKIKNKPPVYEYDKIRTMDKLLKLYSIIVEATNTFGFEYVNGYLDCDLYKSLVQKSYQIIEKGGINNVNKLST